MSRSKLMVSMVVLGGVSSVGLGQVVGASVVGATVLPGTTFVDAAAALGLPPAVVSGGAVTPFSPAFGEENIVVVRPGGSLTVGLSGVVPVGVGLQLGVFSNIGVIDVSVDGSGVAGNPVGAFSAFPRAVVSVSGDGVSFVQVGDGPVTFDRPTNRYLDVAAWTGYSPLPGVVESDVFKPFTGEFADLSGKTYGEMLAVFGGSAGGTWLDLSSTGLSEVRFVRFEVPAGADYRLVLDAVTAVVPEPSGVAGVLGVVAVVGLRRRVR